MRVTGIRLGIKVSKTRRWITKLEALRTRDVSLVKPCLSIIVGTGVSLFEGEERGGRAASRVTYDPSAEGGGADFMVELEITARVDTFQDQPQNEKLDSTA